MPDPLLYGEAFALAGFVSAALTLLFAWIARPKELGGPAFQGNGRGIVLAVGAGFAAGCWLLRLPTAWNPASALDRFLTIVFPMAVTVELIAAGPSVRARLAWVLRGGLALAAGRILLHGSVYLGGPLREWTEGEVAAVLAGSAAALVIVWWLLSALQRRAAGVAGPLSLAMTLVGSGLAIMLEGYLRGGIAPLPLAAAILGGTVAAVRASRTSARLAEVCEDVRAAGTDSLSAKTRELEGVLGLGVVGLFSTLFIGRFFAGLSTGTAAVLIVAPLLGWIAELLPVRCRHGARGLAIRLLLVALPIAIVLLLAMPEFVNETLPLLTAAGDRWRRATALAWQAAPSHCC